MNYKFNIIANYASQIYSMIIGIIMLPLYIAYMGPEAYGLVGFFTMLQVWFTMLDIGLTPTLARETARFYGGAIDPINYRHLIRLLEAIFFGVAVIGAGAIYFSSGYIASDWLQLKQLQISEVKGVLEIIALVIALRWMCGFYRGAISGAERQVWLGRYTIIIATLRSIGIIPVFILIGVGPTIFFGYQLCVAIVEVVWIRAYANSLLPSMSSNAKWSYSVAYMKPVIKFSLTIAFTSSVWVLLTQTDKLVLSKVLALDEYGYFTLAVLMANFVTVIGGPVSTAIMPRMAKLEAEGRHAELVKAYRQATQLVSVIAGAACVTIVFNAESLLLVWTDNQILATKAWKILVLYTIGNGILAITAFPYYLQYAKGNLRLHFIYNIIFIILLIPAIIWAANEYGGIGAGYVWVILNLFSFVVIVPIVHNRFAKGINREWYIYDTLIIVAITILTGYILNKYIVLSESRFYKIFEIVIFGITVLITGILASSYFRRITSSYMKSRKL